MATSRQVRGQEQPQMRVYCTGSTKGFGGFRQYKGVLGCQAVRRVWGLQAMQKGLWAQAVREVVDLESGLILAEQ